MAGSVNKVLLVGRASRDPEIRTTQSGGKIAHMTVATNDSWVDKASGEKRKRAEFHRVVVHSDRIVDVVERFVRKGKQVFVEGSLQTRKFTDWNGNDRTTTEVVIDRFRGELTLLDSGRADDGESEDVSRRAPAAPGRAPARAGATWDAPRDDLDDPLPF